MPFWGQGLGAALTGRPPAPARSALGLTLPLPDRDQQHQPLLPEASGRSALVERGREGQREGRPGVGTIPVSCFPTEKWGHTS